MATRRRDVATEEEILEILSEASQASQRLDAEYDQLKASYPDRWVAVSKDGLVAHHEELAGIVAAFKRAGYTSNQVAVEFLDTEPRILVL